MMLDISPELAAKANKFPESSYGATTVTLVLASGRRIDEVILAGARIVKVGGRMVSETSDLDFSPNEVADVLRTDRPAVAMLSLLWQGIRNVVLVRHSPSGGDHPSGVPPKRS
jgi:hypothetical protein